MPHAPSDLPGRPVVLEIRDRAGWRQVGSVSEAEPPGSLTSDPGGGEARQVYLFGYFDGGPGVWRSEGGVDIAAVRGIATTGLLRLSDLAEPYELAVRRAGETLRLRFRREVSGSCGSGLRAHARRDPSCTPGGLGVRSCSACG